MFNATGVTLKAITDRDARIEAYKEMVLDQSILIEQLTQELRSRDELIRQQENAIEVRTDQRDRHQAKATRLRQTVTDLQMSVARLSSRNVRLRQRGLVARILNWEPA